MADRRSFLLAVSTLPFIGVLDSGVTEFKLKFIGSDDFWTIKLKGCDCSKVLFNGNPMKKVGDKYAYHDDGVMSELKFSATSENEIVVDYVYSAHGKVSSSKLHPVWTTCSEVKHDG